ncbi:MAG: T9SS type A sorting domain-containing protein, partial [Bacteroidia bacterium]|nr:T9SS type A sorting domain-containing protein [Bacteroidia bacterium]
HSYMYRMSGGGVFIDDRDEFRNGGDEFFISACLVRDTNKTGFVRTCSFPNDPFKKKQADIYICEPNFYPYIINDSGDSRDEFAYSIDGTRDGGTIITGSTYGYGAFGADIYFIKRDSLGLTYSSIVSLPEQKGYDHKLLVSHGENYITLSIAEPATVKEINLYDLLGNFLRRINDASNVVTIVFENYPNSMYLIEVKFSDNSSKNIKVIR